jgi:hypothetical protein
MHRTRNAAYGQPYRGFESLPLRQPASDEVWHRRHLNRGKSEVFRREKGSFGGSRNPGFICNFLYMQAPGHRAFRRAETALGYNLD